MSSLAPPFAAAETLPARPEAERSLLGAILIEGSLLSRVIEWLTAEDFASEPHRAIFAAALALADKKDGIDLVTVQHELERTGQLERAGGAAYLSSLVDLVPDVENIESYSRLIREAAMRRALILQSRRVLHDAVHAEDAEVVLESAQRELVEIAKGSLKGGFRQLGHLVEENEREIHEIQKRGSMLTGLPTGFRQMDALTQGLQKSDLIIVAARPGMGKTAFALNIGAFLAVHREKSIGFFSLEMSAAQLAFRVECAEARVNLQRLRKGQLNRDEHRQMFLTGAQLKQAKLFIDDTPSITLLEMRARSLQLKQNHGLDAVFVDYIQIMGSRGKVENRTQEVGSFSRGLKALAKELNVPVIALSQLSRRTEQRGTDKEPQLSDLRESGAIEQDADVVVFLSRPEYYEKDTDEKNVCDVIIAKQRNGPTDRFKLGWSGETTRFSELALVSDAPGY